MSAIELRHYAETPVVLDRARTYCQERNNDFSYGKPNGLWVSVSGDQDWPSWCNAEEFHLGSLTHEYQVTLSAGHNVLYMATAAQLDSFTAAYREGGLYLADRGGLGGIDWTRVAKRWDGIVIAPYQWSRRYSLAWYYGWDCASGCIWNLDVVAEFASAKAMAS